jgi:hypothetical protein
MIHNRWLSIAHHDSQPLAKHNSPCFATFGTAFQSMIHSHWLIFWASGCESWCDMLRIVVVNRDVLCWANTMIYYHWLSIRRHNSQPLVQHNNPWLTTTGSELHTMASGCESWWVLLSQWVWVSVQCSVSGCESWCVMLSQWLWVMVSFAEPVGVSHGITQHDSQPLAPHSTPWFITTG